MNSDMRRRRSSQATTNYAGSIGNNNIEEVEQEEEESDWHLTQWFRKVEEENEDEMPQHDHISSLSFDRSGRFMATGDNSGNVVVLENQGRGRNGAPCHMGFFTEFKSHFLDHSFTRAEDLSPRITSVKFGPCTNDSLSLLVSSESEIKLWKIGPQQQYTYVDWNVPLPPMDIQMHDNQMPHLMDRLHLYLPDNANDMNIDAHRAPIIRRLKVPVRHMGEMETIPIPRKTYARDMHRTGIVGMDVSVDQQHFYSADCLAVNLWNMHIGQRTYKVVDMPVMPNGDCDEIITGVEAHPTLPETFLYTTTAGNINVGDLRLRSTADEPLLRMAHVDQDAPDAGEIIYGISDAKYSKGGRFVVSRDYMSVRLWDVSMPNQPVDEIFFQEFIRPHLEEAKDKGCIGDVFKVGLGARGDIITGTYSNYFNLLDLANKTDTLIKAGTPSRQVLPIDQMRHPVDVEEEGHDYPIDFLREDIDFGSKILHCAWHPEVDTVALTADNNVFVYGRFHQREPVVGGGNGDDRGNGNDDLDEEEDEQEF